MNTVQMAKWARAQVDAQPWQQSWQDEDKETRWVYLGSFMFLDPCGRYHVAVISPNGITQRCERYWESLERQLGKQGLVLEAGEGNATDMFASEWRDRETVEEAEA